MAKILIVDDSEIIRNIMKDIIQPEGHDVYAVENGKLGLNFIKENPDISIIFTDFNMPELNGAEMSKSIINENNDFQGIIVMVTTETDFSLKQQGKSAGVKYWINKPIESDKILKIVNKFAQ